MTAGLSRAKRELRLSSSDSLRSLRYRVRSRVVTRGKPSSIIDTAIRLLGIHPSLTTVEPGAQLLGDGFQGSGNSYFFERFEAAQSREVQLSGHCHSPVKARSAIESNVPTVIIIRDPRDAVVSTLSRWPYIPVTVALHTWHEYYSYLMPYRSDAIVATFSDVIHHPDAVIRRVNKRFGTTFELPTIEPKRGTGDSTREQRKKELRDRVDAAALRPLLLRCRQLHDEFIR